MKSTVVFFCIFYSLTAAAWFGSDGLTISSCNKLKEISGQVELSDNVLSYSLDSSVWPELKRKKISVYRSWDDQVILTDDDICLVLVGERVDKVFSKGFSLKILIKLDDDASVSFRDTSINRDRAMYYKFFADDKRYISYELKQLSVGEVQVFHLEYINAITLQGFEEEKKQQYVKLNEMSVHLLSQFKTKPAEIVYKSKDYIDFSNYILQVTNFTNHPNKGMEVKKIIREMGVSTTVLILRNYVELLHKLDENHNSVDSTSLDLFYIISNLISVYNNEFKYLCKETIDFKLPFIDTQKMNVYEIFNLVMNRVTNILQLNSYSNHLDFINLLVSIESKGLSYRQAIENHDMQIKIQNSYEKIRDSGIGMPVISFAISEVQRLKDLSKFMSHLQIYKELFEGLDLDIVNDENEYFSLLRRQLDLLQAGDLQHVSHSGELTRLHSELKNSETYLISSLRDKTAKLYEIMSYLQEIDSKVVLVERLCP